MSNFYYMMERISDTREKKLASSFEERSVWIQLIVMSLVMGGYFVDAWRMFSKKITWLPAYAFVFGLAVVLMVIFMIAGHVAVAIANRPEGRDERDRLIRWKAESRSRWVLASGVFIGIEGMVISLPGVLIAHLLLLSLFLSELLKLVLQIVDYRRGP
jgi:hypothetical protein